MEQPLSRILARLPRVNFARFPTPVEELKRMTRTLNGARLFVKRDDLMELAFGGNKVRKLEFLMADAVRCGADTIITTGAVHSNHARLTAAAARKLGLDVVLVLNGEQPASAGGNLLLETILGVDVRFYDVQPSQTPSIMEEIADAERAKGHTPYVIPRGGAAPLGVLGYVLAAAELKDQLSQTGPSIDHIVFPTGTGATQAGLQLGRDLFGLSAKVVGISVGRSSDEIARDAARLATETAALLGASRRYAQPDFTVVDDYVCGGYGVVANEVLETIKIVAKTEGLFLDPVYTGKAMYGLLELGRKGFFEHESHIMFVHTGGTPIIFSHFR